jgi:hypothetical protein
VLLPEHLFAFKHSKDKQAHGHLTTTKCAVQVLSEATILVTTPLRSLELRLAHEFEAFEWIRGIMKSSETNNCGSILQEMHARLNAKQQAALNEKPPIDDKHMHVQVHFVCKTQLVPVQAVALVHGKNVVGRDSSCRVPIKDANLSRSHCRIEITNDGRAKVVDCGSSNGVLLNGKKVVSQAGLTGGDVILLGSGTVLSIGEPDEAQLAAYRAKLEANSNSKSKEETRAPVSTSVVSVGSFGASDTGMGLIDV